jgi:hypothetical protein
MTAGAQRSDAGGRRLRVGACLSLSGRHARFGRQAALGLEIWQGLESSVDLVVEDDHSDPRTLETALKHVAADTDILLGPYSTQLMRAAGRVAADAGWLLWNHGGSGDDVEASHPGYIVSVLTPTSRYAHPFLRWLASTPGPRAKLWIAYGKGSFGRQVAAGAEALAQDFGIDTARIGPGDDLPMAEPQPPWDLFCAASFDEDVQIVRRALSLPQRPSDVCAVAAGVREFGTAIDDPEGIFGVGQWRPHSGHVAEIGPAETDFMAAYTDRAGVPPNYPAVQAAAGAALAVHCAKLAGGTTRELLWSAATALDTTTLFGGFKIDPRSGVQVKHETALVRWTSTGPTSM